MFIVYLGVYTLVLVLVWGLFLVTRLHAYKFKNFSHNITKVTNLLMIFLGIISLFGYILLIMNYDSANTAKIDFKDATDIQEVNY
ncbi:MAG: hypothetical protein GY828_05805 [Candidatus Gracilibacteria bacterium]|nr:hypothetical protein [Candidatus Gracilibacteria bacterium]